MVQQMIKAVEQRVRTTLAIMSSLAESVGVPATVTELIQGLEKRLLGGSKFPAFKEEERPSAVAAERLAVDFREESLRAITQDPVEQEDSTASLRPAKQKGKKKRGTDKAHGLPEGVRNLSNHDAINGSTYLARIIWSLGVASLDGTGPLRPADMARMILTRTSVNLDPPNVARYIRRSKPTCVEVDHSEGSSSFYRLNSEGLLLFNEKFKR